MKKTLLSLFGIFALGLLQAQVCVPNTTITSPGLYPINGYSNGFDTVIMANASVGILYDEIVQLKVPSDTVIDTAGFILPAVIDSLQILNVLNLPTGFTYNCDKPDCDYLGGDNGCLRFQGTPASGDLGTRTVLVEVSGSINAGIFGTLTDTLYFRMELTVAQPQSIDEYISANSLKFSPNPTSGSGKLSFAAIKNAPYQIRVLSITGQTMAQIQGQAQLGENAVAINGQNWPPGMYLYSLTINGAQRTGRFVVTH